MLQRIGDGLKGQRWLAYLVLGALALVFAAWGAYGIVDLGFRSGTYAVKAGGQEISVDQARDAWSQQQAQWEQRFGGNLPPELQKGLQDNLLESMARSALLTAKSYDLGYRVGDRHLHEAIQTEPAFQIDGKYSPEVAKSRLAQAGISAEAFEADLRRSLQRAQLEDGVQNSSFLTPREAERLRALRGEQREVRYVLLSAEKFAGKTPIDDAAIQAYYKSHESEFMTPESARVQFAELRLDQLATQVQISDVDLKARYDETKDQYVEPEKRHARHILIEAGKDDAAALKEAQEVLAEARAGKDFATLAKQHSDDAGSAAQGGDLGWAERSYFVAPFADAVFSMKVGEISGPVKTQFGYHIIRLDEIQPGKTKSFEEARSDIEASLRRDRAADRFGEVQEQLQQRLEQAGASLEELARDLGLHTGEVAEFLREGGGAPLGDSPELQEVVFGDAVLNQHRIGGPIILGEDRLVIVRALEHRTPQPKPIADVKETIVAALRKERGTQAAVVAAEAARKRLEAGESFESAIRGFGVDTPEARYVGRQDASMPQQVLQTIFTSPKPAAGHPVVRSFALTDGGAALLTITGVRVDPDVVTTADATASPEARQVATRKGAEEFATYVEELRRTADVEKNPQTFE